MCEAPALRDSRCPWKSRSLGSQCACLPPAAPLRFDSPTGRLSPSPGAARRRLWFWPWLLDPLDGGWWGGGSDLLPWSLQR